MSQQDAMIQDTTSNLLDELCLVPASLDSRLESVTGVDLTTRFSVVEQRRNARITSPFILRSIVDTEIQPDQIDGLCGSIREVGGGVLAESKSLNQIAIQNVPFRICPVFIDSFPERAELESADVIELQMFARRQGSKQLDPQLAAWPWDVLHLEHLAKKLEVLRQLAGASIPVGVAIPVGSIRSDVATLIRCGIDYISLVRPTQPEKCVTSFPDPWIAVAARVAATQGGRPNLPIFLSTSIRHGRDIAKLVALGVTGVLVDSIVKPKAPPPSQPAYDPMAYSMLSDITSGFQSTSPANPFDETKETLRRFIAELTETLRVCGCQTLDQLSPKCLMATSHRAHEMTGIAKLVV